MWITKKYMPKKNKLTPHLLVQRREVIWLLDHWGYNGPDIGAMVGLDRSGVTRNLKTKPKDWKPDFKKVR